MKNLVVSICSIISIFIGVKTLYGKEIANLNDARPVYVNILKHCGVTQLRFLKDFGILIILYAGQSSLSLYFSLKILSKGLLLSSLFKNKASSRTINNLFHGR